MNVTFEKQAENNLVTEYSNSKGIATMEVTYYSQEARDNAFALGLQDSDVSLLSSGLDVFTK